MTFGEIIKKLRTDKGLTQDELAEKIYVTRTAISKWESGRGFPNIESLKAISKYFSVSLDELLSGEEILAIAENDNKQKERTLRDLIFGLLDCGMALLLFLPFFGQKADGVIREVSLIALSNIQTYLKTAYIAFGHYDACPAKLLSKILDSEQERFVTVIKCRRCLPIHYKSATLCCGICICLFDY